ncbi:GNAT family N-acetyltransferase [Streptomyces tsukubensis]|uniref:GNAT family N-acetyltransferase n=1 Tax=Streptomyces tsukubensis TaxID=83656 RepID=A0A1V4A5P8_9ACTN|nr:GNAT family N-acetyltransferase [Streptomyces tsukubensis]OON76439.1 GNAT family N-acetyltransferase [Streptomyces tsukubensis]QFR96016.1 GNAT family N-acetyltransferase [Streptomyces tsukubensis]
MSSTPEKQDVTSEDLLAAYDAQLRGVTESLDTGVVAELDGPVTRISGRRQGFVSGPRDLGVTGSALDTLIARQRDHFAARGESVEWKTRAHDLPVDIPERLRAAGFVPEERETVLVGRSEKLAGEPLLPAGVTLRRVSSRYELDRIDALGAAVWGEGHPALAEDLQRQLGAAPDDLIVLVAEAAGELVCAARLELTPGLDFAGLWGGNTLEAWRGKGLYRATVAARAKIAAERGVPYLQVDASDDSAPILRRLGFVEITTTTPYVWSPDAPANVAE